MVLSPEERTEAEKRKQHLLFVIALVTFSSVSKLGTYPFDAVLPQQFVCPTKRHLGQCLEPHKNLVNKHC